MCFKYITYSLSNQWTQIYTFFYFFAWTLNFEVYHLFDSIPIFIYMYAY